MGLRLYYVTDIAVISFVSQTLHFVKELRKLKQHQRAALEAYKKWSIFAS